MTAPSRETLQFTAEQTLVAMASEFNVVPSELELQAMTGLLLNLPLPTTEDEKKHHSEEKVRGLIQLAEIRQQTNPRPENERSLALRGLLKAVRPMFKGDVETEL